MINKLIKEYSMLQTHINKLTDTNIEVPRNLKERRINIIQQLDDTFEKSQPEDISNYEHRIKFNSMLKFFSEELGLPTEKYVENIKLLTQKMGVPLDD